MQGAQQHLQCWAAQRTSRAICLYSTHAGLDWIIDAIVSTLPACARCLRAELELQQLHKEVSKKASVLQVTFNSQENKHRVRHAGDPIGKSMPGRGT